MPGRHQHPLALKPAEHIQSGPEAGGIGIIGVVDIAVGQQLQPVGHRLEHPHRIDQFLQRQAQGVGDGNAAHEILDIVNAQQTGGEHPAFPARAP